MGILKDDPFTFGIFNFLFALVGLLCGLEVHRMPQVLTPAIHNSCYRGIVPAIGITLLFYITRDAFAFVVSGRSEDFPLPQLSCYLGRSKPIHNIQPDFIDHIGSLTVGYPMFAVIRVFHVSVRRISRQMFSGVPFDLHHSTDFLAGVFRIPLIDDIAEGSKLIVALGAVHPIVYGDKVNIMLREHDLGIHTHLQIITAKTGHIFDDDPFDDPCLHIGDHLLETRSIEGCS